MKCLSPQIRMLPLSGRLQGGIWGWLQACLTPSFCAPAQRHKHHADKHTPTLTHNTAHYNNTNIHLTAHIITCDAHRPSLPETHMPAYMGGISMPVWLPSRFVPPTQVPDPSCVYRNKPCWWTQSVAKCQTLLCTNTISKCIHNMYNFWKQLVWLILKTACERQIYLLYQSLLRCHFYLKKLNVISNWGQCMLI